MSIALLVLVIGQAATFAQDGAQPVDYLRDIKPILRSRCYACHGPLKQQGGLRLDTVSFATKGGDGGPAIVPGDVASSPLVERVTAADPPQRMPPEGKPLTPEQITLLTRWVATGAAAPENETPLPDPRSHWAFQKPVAVPLPAGNGDRWQRNPIDAFIAQTHRQNQLVPHGPASRDALLRRVTLDLTGLPPTRDERRAFLQDTSPDAYERLVDRLLASPQYGERWGRHWMDVWRYSDWYGRRDVNDVRNSYAQIWRWRDWIVRSLNEDKGYDRMVVEMLAADEVAPEDDATQVATGYIVRNWYSLNYNQWMRDLVEHTGKAFLGLTLNCAHCHDHKYDPISQREYFQFRAFFEPLEIRRDRVAGEPDPGPFQDYLYASSTAPITSGLVRVYDKKLDAVTRLYHGGDERNIMEDKPPAAPLPPAVLGGDRTVVSPVTIPPAGHYPGLKPFVRQETLAVVEERVRTSTVARESVAAALKGARETWSRSRAANAGARSLAELVPREQLFGEWRFEGDEENFLADSSGNRRTLERITGTDPRVVPNRPESPLARGGSAYATTGEWGSRIQQAEFQQLTNFAYLATGAKQAPPVGEFAITLRTHISQASAGFNRTWVEHGGSWIWLHRGIDANTSELRFLLYDEAGNLRDVATGKGQSPLLLTTGRDYFLGALLDKDQISLFAVDLERDGVAQMRQFPRTDGVHSFVPLRSPQGEQRIKIGNSDGSGRHVGLIDEVCYAAVPPALDAFAALFATVAKDVIPDRVFRTAQHASQVGDAVADAARLELQAAQARIAADDLRFLTLAAVATESGTQPPGPALSEPIQWATQKAGQLERQSATATAHSRWLAALGDRAATLEWSPVDAAVLAKSDSTLTATAAALAQARATEATPVTTYTPLSPQYPTHSTGRRRALAEWITSRDNPLTARVAVNHIWLRHFGRPLVESVTDFGNNGKRPSHPELLDWLAVELMRGDWKMKPLHRLIVLSQTYQLDSIAEGADGPNGSRDRDNRTLWRYPARRMESEAVRDGVLFAAGGLDLTPGGPELPNSAGMTSPRRSLYFSQHAEGGGRMEFESLFDPPDVCDCYRRTQSIMPQQSLALTNSDLVRAQSRRLAAALWKQVLGEHVEPADRNKAFVVAAYEQILTREPSPNELQTCLDFLAEQQSFLEGAQGAGASASNSAGDAAATDTGFRARAGLVRALFNHHDYLMLK